jgi:hypothetical protein
VRAETDGGGVSDNYSASVLLSSGGYVMNGPMFEKLSGHKQYTAKSLNADDEDIVWR